jgi:hypothetical protein
MKSFTHVISQEGCSRCVRELKKKRRYSIEQAKAEILLTHISHCAANTDKFIFDEFFQTLTSI